MMKNDNDQSQTQDRMCDVLNQNMSRRQTLKSLAAAGFMATAGSGLLLGPKARAEENKPKYGGHIRLAVHSSSTADTLDPARGSTAIDYYRDFMFYSGLTDFDENLKPIPALAENFDTPDKGKTWVFSLRKGVTFHNGKPLSPDDVIFSIMRHKKPETGSKIKPLVDQVEKAVASAPNEVTVTLSSANIEFPSITALVHMLIVPDGTTDFSKGIGTGPFKCHEFKPGIRSIARRNENYWKPNKPYLDSVEAIGIGDDSSRINALLSGDVQVISHVPFNSTGRIEKSPDTSLYTTNAGNYTDLIMRLDLQPGARPDFVEGMKYLLDRDRIQDVIFGGYAEVANDQPIPPSNPYYFADLPQRPYDPDRAKALFKKAGVAGAEVKVVASEAVTKSIDMAALLQQSAAQAGLRIKIDRVPSAGYWSNYWAQKPVTYGNIAARPTAQILLNQFFASDAPWNESHWRDEKFDQLLAGVSKEPDEAKRVQMYADMQRMIHDSSGIGIPVFIVEPSGYNSKIGGMDRKIPLSYIMGGRFTEYVWWKG